MAKLSLFGMWMDIGGGCSAAEHNPELADKSSSTL